MKGGIILTHRFRGIWYCRDGQGRAEPFTPYLMVVRKEREGEGRGRKGREEKGTDVSGEKE